MTDRAAPPAPVVAALLGAFLRVPPDEVVQAGGVAVVVRKREALQAYERALHAARDPARDRTRDLMLDTEEEVEAAAVRIARDRG